MVEYITRNYKFYFNYSSPYKTQTLFGPSYFEWLSSILQKNESQSKGNTGHIVFHYRFRYCETFPGRFLNVIFRIKNLNFSVNSSQWYEFNVLIK
jgi:hypothetical protein